MTDIFFKILVLFLIGIFSRFLINNLFNYTLLVELFSFFSISLCISQFSFLNSVDPKFFEDNVNLFKRPRDRVLDNNSVSEDYGFGNKFRRKCHWVFLKQFSSEFENFKDFKNSWDPNKKYINLLKGEYYDKKYKVRLFKRTFLYIINGRKRS